MLVNAVLELFPHKKLVAASGMAGFGDSNAIRTRQIMRNFYLCGDEESGIDTKKRLQHRALLFVQHTKPI